jgi:hypothetical protein
VQKLCKSCVRNITHIVLYLCLNTTQTRHANTNYHPWCVYTSFMNMCYRGLKETNPPPSLLVRNWVEPPPKNKQGIGTSTYMRAAGKMSWHHQPLNCDLKHRTWSTCNTLLTWQHGPPIVVYCTSLSTEKKRQAINQQIYTEDSMLFSHFSIRFSIWLYAH